MSASVTQERWFVKYWRPAAAWVYLSICVFDFVAMPIYHLRSQGDLDRIVEISSQLRPEDRLSAIVQLNRRTAWEPLTLAESGLFHVAFATVLGVAAWTRGRVQEQIVRSEPRRRRSQDDDWDDTPDPSDGTTSAPPPRPPRRATAIDTNSY